MIRRLKLISFMHFLRQITVSYPREKTVSASLQNPVNELFFISHDAETQCLLKASLVRFTLIELSRRATLTLLSKTTSSRGIS